MNKRPLYRLLIGTMLVATSFSASAQADPEEQVECVIDGVEQGEMAAAECLELERVLENEPPPEEPGPGEEPDPGENPDEPDPDEDPEKPEPDPKPEPPGGGGGGGTGGGGGGGGHGGGGGGGGGHGGGHGGGGGGGGGGHGGGHGGGGGGGGTRSDGSPSRSNPTTTDTGPSPLDRGPIPNFVIEKFKVPLFLFPLYEAAGTQYGVDWEVLAAINEIETDYGRNLNVSSAGAQGWMQFMPPTWRQYGVDANKDGERDPYNPADAIFAAARYLKAAGYQHDERTAIFAYNHADWYVDSVLMRARAIRGIPPDLTGSLSGLAQGRFPVADRARYADNIKARELRQSLKPGANPAQVESSDPSRTSIEVFSHNGAPVVASNDGEVKEIGRSRKLGHYIVLQDVYGNRYTYAGLSKVAKTYPAPRGQDLGLSAQGEGPGADPAPDAAASVGHARPGRIASAGSGSAGGSAQTAVDPPIPERLFAHPERPAARAAGGLEQLVAAGIAPGSAQGSLGSADPGLAGSFAEPFTAGRGTRPAPLRKGAQVIGGTILGRIGHVEAGKAPHLDFAIRPAGRGAPQIDPKVILDGWKLLEETAIYRANGRNVLQGGTSIGQLILMPKPLLERRVLHDQRIDVYPCGRRDIKTGQINQRVLVTMAYLAESGFRPGVTSLKCGHGRYTTSGQVSNHASGNAVDIAQLNGVPVLGHQDKGGIVEHAVKRILQLQGTMTPDEVISLFNFGGPSFAMGDHNDHIHVGFTPLFGDNKKLGKQALKVLTPGKWHRLIDRIGQIKQPNVRRKSSRSAIPAGQRASRAHRGE